MKVLVTGSAGFIGSYVAKRCVASGYSVVGLDNLNSYYDVGLKLSRLADSGIVFPGEASWGEMRESEDYGEAYRFVRMNLEDSDAILKLFADERFDIVVHLAAQAGVRNSGMNPAAYIRSNIDGFLNILEGCRLCGVRHLLFASSSSVYGLNGKTPFSEKDGVSHPVSLYAATKISNEMMAHAYSDLYDLPATGLRFFTVYGPWGRPDMSPHLFMDAILSGKPLKVFNKGDMWRDFTFVDDVVESVVRVMEIIPGRNECWDSHEADPSTSRAPYRIYNVGNGAPVSLIDYVRCIELAAGREADKEYLPMQPGDVYKTYADSSSLFKTTGFSPSTTLQEGISRTLEWFRSYYQP